MARFRGFYDKHLGKVVWVPEERVLDMRAKRRNNPVAPAVFGDTMDPIKGPDGEFYDSKVQYESAVESKGFRILGDTEKPSGAGWEAPTTKEWLDEVAEDADQACRRAMNDLRYGQNSLSEEDKEYAKTVNEIYKSKTGKEPVITGGID